MRYVFFILAAIFCLSVFSGCATATPVPNNATPEQIEHINAQNLEAIATNTATLSGFTIASIIISFLVSLITMGAMM